MSEAPREPGYKPPGGESSPGGWTRDPKARTPLPDFFHGELMTIYEGLGQLCRRQREQNWFKRQLRIEWGGVFGWIATLAFGAFITGVLAWLTSHDAHLSKTSRLDLHWFVFISGLVTALAGLARMGIRDKEAQSVYGIYRFVGNILATYRPQSEVEKKDEAS